VSVGVSKIEDTAHAQDQDAAVSTGISIEISMLFPVELN
jgi:hypothetical protein